MRDNYRSSAVVGVETECRCLLDVLIEKKDNMVFRVVDKSKGTDATGFEPQVTQHTLRRSEREFARRGVPCRHERGFQTLLQVVNGKVVTTIEADKVVLITLVVAHEDILTMHTAVCPPPATCLLDGLPIGVRIAGVGDVVRLQILLYLHLSLTDDGMVAHRE